MKKRDIISFLAILGFAVQLGAAVNQKLPNIIFLVLDDVSFDEIGVFQDRYYDQKVLTPNLDKFAETAIRLTNLHSPSSICTPARYSYMTGNYASRASSVLDEAPEGLYSFVRWNSYLEPGDPTLLSFLLRNEGYTTGMIGKWHISKIDLEIPDNVPAALMEDNPDPRDLEISSYLWNRYDEACGQLAEDFGFDHVSRFTEGNAKDNALSEKLGLLTHNPEWVVEGGLDFMEANRDRPFFMYMALTLLHDDPITPLEEQSTMLTPAGYLDKPIEIISPRREIMARTRAAGLPDKRAGNLWMDELFGVLVEKLEVLGLRENTMIILTSDHSLYGKGTCYDAGTKSLTMVSWPERIKGGGSTDVLLSAIDHYPTILEAVGAKVIPEVDGLSYLPVLMGSEEPIHDEIFFELGDMRGIRTDSFKYITRRPILKRSWEALPQTPLVKEAKRIHDYYFRDFNRYLADTWSGRSGTDFYITHAANFFNRDQLYYLDNDPDELDNLAGNTDYADVLGDLQERLSEWLELMPGGVYPL